MSDQVELKDIRVGRCLVCMECGRYDEIGVALGKSGAETVVCSQCIDRAKSRIDEYRRIIDSVTQAAKS